VVPRLSVSHLGLPSGNSFGPITAIDRLFTATEPLAQATDKRLGPKCIMGGGHWYSPMPMVDRATDPDLGF
jgi:hypothetical protein